MPTQVKTKYNPYKPGAKHNVAKVSTTNPTLKPNVNNVAKNPYSNRTSNLKDPPTGSITRRTNSTVPSLFIHYGDGNTIDGRYQKERLSVQYDNLKNKWVIQDEVYYNGIYVTKKYK